MQKRTVASKLACAFKKVSADDLKSVPGLVDSKYYFVPSAATRAPTEEEAARFRNQGLKVPAKILVKAIREPAKVFYLKMTGHPSIILAYIVWPVKKGVKRLCDEVSSFYLDKGIYFTGKSLNVTASPSRTATKKEQDNFPALYNTAMNELEAGKALIYSADSNATKAIAAIKKLFGV